MAAVEYLAIHCPGDTPPCNLDGLVGFTKAAIKTLALVRASVDAFTDCRSLPLDAAAALSQLEAIAGRRHEHDEPASPRRRWLSGRSPSNMGVELDLDGDQRSVVEVFGPYSIHTEVLDARGERVLVLHDSGDSVRISARLDEAPLVERLLADAGATFTIRP